VSSSSSSGLVVAPIVIFFNVIMGFFRTLMNPLSAGKKIISAPFNLAKKGVRGVGRFVTKRRQALRRVGGGFKRFFRCFSPETPIKLQDGTTVKIKNLKLGDTLINGSVVDAVMKIKNYNDPYYKIGDIYVTGKHYVKHGMKYVQVKDLPNAKLTDKVDDVVSCLVTSDHKIPVGNMLFWDWEDNLIPTKKNVDVIFNKIRSARAARKTVAQ